MYIKEKGGGGGAQHRSELFWMCCWRNVLPVVSCTGTLLKNFIKITLHRSLCVQREEGGRLAVVEPFKALHEDGRDWSRRKTASWELAWCWWLWGEQVLTDAHLRMLVAFGLVAIVDIQVKRCFDVNMQINVVYSDKHWHLVTNLFCKLNMAAPV